MAAYFAALRLPAGPLVFVLPIATLTAWLNAFRFMFLGELL